MEKSLNFDVFELYLFKNREIVFNEPEVHLPDKVCKHWPLVVSQTLTVESAFPDTRIFCRSSMPEVRL